MTHWLTAPELLPIDHSGLPDPLARVGRHVAWVCVFGAVLSHGDWTRSHDGLCPALCSPLPRAAPANFMGSGEATRAWQALFGKKVRKPFQEWVKGPQVVPLKFDVEPYA